MRWLFTRHAPDLVEAVVAAGHEIVGDAGCYVDARVDLGSLTLDANDYPMRAMLDAHQPDVLVVVDPLIPNGTTQRVFGCPRAALGRWANRFGPGRQRRTLIMWTRDPDVVDRYREKRHPNCVARLQDATIFAAPNAEQAAYAARFVRACSLTDGWAALAAALDHARSGATYVMGKTAQPFKG